MITRNKAWSLLVLGSLSIGCDEPESGQGPRPTKGPQYGVVSSDFSATSVSLLGIDGNLLEDDYINSGSAESGLVTALSGDVTLPTRSGEDGVLVLIDRFKADVITRIRLADGKILGQLKTHTPPDQETENAFTSNPYDYVFIDESTAWVTRNQPNLDPDADEIDLGNDLLRIDPSKMLRSDERIDLSAFNGTATRVDPDSGKAEKVDIYARPGRMVRLADTLIVGLGRSAFDFSAIGAGMVALVDLKSKKTQGLSFEDLKGCSDVKPVPSEDDLVLVTCSGVYSEERDTVGLAFVRVTDGKAKIENIWRAKDHPKQPANLQPAIALSAHELIVAANDYSGKAESKLLRIDVTSEKVSELLTIDAGLGDFGTSLFDEREKKLFVPDTSVDSDKVPLSGVHVLQQQDDGSFEEIDLITPAAETGMPVRHLYQL